MPSSIHRRLRRLAAQLYASQTRPSSIEDWLHHTLLQHSPPEPSARAKLRWYFHTHLARLSAASREEK